MKHLLTLLAALFLISCGGEANRRNPEGIDVDLSRLSATMIYSEVYNMINSPEKYAGKTVRMKGVLNNDGYSGKKYCVIADAAACCTQGVEFIITGENHPAFQSYNMMAPPAAGAKPIEYPKNGSKITVVGTFSTYIDHGQPCIALTEAAFQ